MVLSRGMKIILSGCSLWDAQWLRSILFDHLTVCVFRCGLWAWSQHTQWLCNVLGQDFMQLKVWGLGSSWNAYDDGEERKTCFLCSFCIWKSNLFTAPCFYVALHHHIHEMLDLLLYCGILMAPNGNNTGFFFLCSLNNVMSYAVLWIFQTTFSS